MRWPLGIALGLAVVVMVDAVFIVVSSRNAPEIEASYAESQDR